MVGKDYAQAHRAEGPLSRSKGPDVRTVVGYGTGWIGRGLRHLAATQPISNQGAVVDDDEVGEVFRVPECACDFLQNPENRFEYPEQ